MLDAPSVIDQNNWTNSTLLWVKNKNKRIGEVKESTRIFRFAVIGTLNALITAVTIWVMMDELDINYMLLQCNCIYTGTDS